MAGLYGVASWFCCGNAWGPCGTAGFGACGTCNSGSFQHAWPNASDACFAVTRPDACGESLSRRTCGFTHRTTNLCNGRQVATTIADCGPHTDMFCGQTICCGGGTNCTWNRLIDFTPAAFSSLGSLSSGVLPVLITA
jgi:hypothetical protein